jgi:pyruvate kinase
MGERAECVMLNKGPYILQAVRVLDDILQRMEKHQSKKRSMLRHLRLADNLSVKQKSRRTRQLAEVAANPSLILTLSPLRIRGVQLPHSQ